MAKPLTLLAVVRLLRQSAKESARIGQQVVRARIVREIAQREERRANG